ncbi:MAG: glycoside hydrolase family 99-like domain-containing protein [Elusimicrobiota bacterium]|jgi:lipopolysaccharide biosynthesis protein|nr:glycoside hydrolase family 99-like domain-containing protein [Elusimicrobiota bacterium]
MKKLLINLISAFIPKKELRKKVRNKLFVKFIKDKENAVFYGEFVKYLENKDNKDCFVDIAKTQPSKSFDIKLLAFYLPQFYPIEQNSRNYCQGFTEWFNVTKATPLFKDHYQPRLPIDVGFYDLSHEDIMFRQIELAKLYGVYGFCAYYYWFSGEKLLDKPFNNYLKNKSLDFPFCFCWALENWTRKWDAGDKEVIMRQEFKSGDVEKFFYDIEPYWRDARYIKIDGKILLVVYKPHLFDKETVKTFFESLRKLAEENNVGELYLIYARTSEMFESEFHSQDTAEWGFDAYADFPPHNLRSNKNKELNVPDKKIFGYVNPNFDGRIYDMESYVKNEIYLNDKNDVYNLFKACFPSWDNTPRFPNNGSVLFGLTPELYKQWLKYCLSWTKKYHKKDEQIVFINAWNEWAEGAHLEPDRKYGYAYLQATRDALEESL